MSGAPEAVTQRFIAWIEKRARAGWRYLQKDSARECARAGAAHHPGVLYGAAPRGLVKCGEPEIPPQANSAGALQACASHPTPSVLGGHTAYRFFLSSGVIRAPHVSALVNCARVLSSELVLPPSTLRLIRHSSRWMFPSLASGPSALKKIKSLEKTASG